MSCVQAIVIGGETARPEEWPSDPAHTLTSGTLSTDRVDKDRAQQPDTDEGLSSQGHGTHTPAGQGQDTGVVVVQPAAVQQERDAVQVIHLWREGPGHSPVDSEGCSF